MIYIVGRPFSGRETCRDILLELNESCEVLKTLEDFLPLTDDPILFIDAPALMCVDRMNTSRPQKALKDCTTEDYWLQHVTELPQCTIIKNDSDIDHFRLKIKKFIASKQ